MPSHHNDHVEIVVINETSFISKQRIQHLLLEATKDITVRTHRFAQQFAPEGPTQRLHEAIFRHDPSGFLHGYAIGEVGSDDAKARHAKFVRQGTGIFGPRRSPIVPRRAKFLVFYWHKMGRWVRTKSVKGQPPQPYIAEAFDVVTRTYVPLRVERLRAQLFAEV